MNLNKTLKIIKYFEKLELTAYKCSENKLTIGYGCTNPKYAFEGNEITELVADGLLMIDIKEAMDRLHKLKVSVNDNQLACLTSQCFNLSVKSTNKLIGYLSNDVELYKNKMLLYHNKNSVASRNGLLIRRICERLLFEGKEWLNVAKELQSTKDYEASKQKCIELFDLDIDKFS